MCAKISFSKCLLKSCMIPAIPKTSPTMKLYTPLIFKIPAYTRMK